MDAVLVPELKNDRAEPQQVQTLVLPKNFEISAEMQTAINAVSAGKSIFITGRAGTGKSTLLTYLREEVLKDTFIVVAPTGVAAINVGQPSSFEWLVGCRQLNQSSLQSLDS